MIYQTGLLWILPVWFVGLFLFYLMMKLADFGTGILKFKRLDNFKSRIMRDGLIRWCGEFIVITIFIVLDIFLGLKFAVCGSLLAFFIYKEWGSVKENLKECGVELPNWIDKPMEKFNTNEVPKI